MFIFYDSNKYYILTASDLGWASEDVEVTDETAFVFESKELEKINDMPLKRGYSTTRNKFYEVNLIQAIDSYIAYPFQVLAPDMRMLAKWKLDGIL